MGANGWTRLVLAGGLGALLVLAAIPGLADTSGLSTDKLVTVQVSNTPVIDVIDLVFRQVGYKYTIEPGVSGNITLSLKSVEFGTAIKALADGANLAYKISDGRFLISPRPKPKAISAATAKAKTQTAAPAKSGTPGPGDVGPIMYGTPVPVMPDVVQYPIGPDTIYVFPGIGSVYVSGANIQSDLRTPLAIDSPALTSPDWQRFKRELWLSRQSRFLY
jgi:hypothetical protein